MLKDLAKNYMEQGGVILYMDYAFLDRGCSEYGPTGDAEYQLLTLEYKYNDFFKSTPDEEEAKLILWNDAKVGYFAENFNNLDTIKHLFSKYLHLYNKDSGLLYSTYSWRLDAGKMVCDIMRTAEQIQINTVNALEKELRTKYQVKLEHVPVKGWFQGHEPVDRVSAVVGYPTTGDQGLWTDGWFVHIRDSLFGAAGVNGYPRADEAFHYNRNGHLSLAKKMWDTYSVKIHEWRAELLGIAAPEVLVKSAEPVSQSM